jgi:hypothetical protein
MPLEHRNLYVSTTLMIVIFTTIFCGGLTEPMLTRMGMRVEKTEGSTDDAEDSIATQQTRRMTIDSTVTSPVVSTSSSREQRQQGSGSDLMRVITGLFNRNSFSSPLQDLRSVSEYEVCHCCTCATCCFVQLLIMLFPDFSRCSPLTMTGHHRLYREGFQPRPTNG